jgi:hypothetical protein
MHLLPLSDPLRFHNHVAVLDMHRKASAKCLAEMTAAGVTFGWPIEGLTARWMSQMGPKTTFEERPFLAQSGHSENRVCLLSAKMPGRPGGAIAGTVAAEQSQPGRTYGTDFVLTRYSTICFSSSGEMGAL